MTEFAKLLPMRAISRAFGGLAVKMYPSAKRLRIE